MIYKAQKFLYISTPSMKSKRKFEVQNIFFFQKIENQ